MSEGERDNWMIQKYGYFYHRLKSSPGQDGKTQSAAAFTAPGKEIKRKNPLLSSAACSTGFDCF